MSEAWGIWVAPGSDQIVSSSAHRPLWLLFWRWRGCWSRLRAGAKKSFKKAELARRRRGDDHGARGLFYLAGRVRLRFHRGIGAGIGHVAIGRAVEILCVGGVNFRA